jgi:hypothetical protein
MKDICRAVPILHSRSPHELHASSCEGVSVYWNIRYTLDQGHPLQLPCGGRRLKFQSRTVRSQCFYIYPSSRGRANVGIPKGFPKSVGRAAPLFADRLHFSANHTVRQMARERQIPRPWYVGWALVPVTERWLKSLNQGNPLRQVRGILSGYGYSGTCLSQTWSPTLGPSCRVLARHG